MCARLLTWRCNPTNLPSFTSFQAGKTKTTTLFCCRKSLHFHLLQFAFTHQSSHPRRPCRGTRRRGCSNHNNTYLTIWVVDFAHHWIWVQAHFIFLSHWFKLILYWFVLFCFVVFFIFFWVKSLNGLIIIISQKFKFNSLKMQMRAYLCLNP